METKERKGRALCRFREHRYNVGKERGEEGAGKKP